MTIRTLIAQFGYCNFCHTVLPLQQPCLWDSEARKCFHLGCPPLCTPFFKNTQQNETSTLMHAAQTQQVSTRRNIADVAVKTLDAYSYNVPTLTALFDGKFTIPCVTQQGIESHVTIRLKTRTRGKYTGSRIVSVHFGRHAHMEFILCGYILPNGEFRFYRSFKEEPDLQGEKQLIVIEAIKLVLTGKENPQFAMTYAKLSRKCWRCGKDLTHQYTLDHLEERGGLGPECFRLVGINDTLLLNRLQQTIMEPVTIIA